MGTLCWIVIPVLLATAGSSGSQPVDSCRIQVGCCAPIRDLEAVRSAGFDYFEIRVAEVEALSDEEFQKLQGRLKELNLPVPVANYFLPGRIRVTGPSTDREQQLAYLRKALERMASLGVKIIVFGSSGARNVPAGFSKDDAFRQLVEFCRMAAAEAEARIITIVIEPLRPQESNIINTAAEGLALVEAVAHPRLQLLVDFYHMATQKEDFSIIDRAGSRILHAHIANPEGRVYPKPGDGCDYTDFFAALRRIAYCGGISIEANTSDMNSDGPTAISLIRKGSK